MKRTPAAPDPDSYVEALDGWRRRTVEQMRAVVREFEPLRETIRWGHLVYQIEGPVLLIRAEEERVLLGFWKGKRLVGIEPRLRPGGKYELATADLREGDRIGDDTVRELVRTAIEFESAADE
jgi:hypothetical protein